MSKTVAPTLQTVSWEEVARAIFAARGIRTGLWSIGVGFQMAALNGQWQHDTTGEVASFPTAMLGVSGLVLREADKPGPIVFDAALAVGQNTSSVAAVPRPAPVAPRRRKTG